MYDLQWTMYKVKHKNYGQTGREMFRTTKSDYIMKICESHCWDG